MTELKPSTKWKRLRQQILERDRWTCHYCGEPATHVDHIIPRVLGGSDAWWNLLAACASCNLRKGSQLPAWAHSFQRSCSDREAAELEHERAQEEIRVEGLEPQFVDIVLEAG